MLYLENYKNYKKKSKVYYKTYESKNDIYGYCRNCFRYSSC